METNAPLSNLQLELLKLYAHNVSDEDLLVIKHYLAQYFINRAIQEADQVWVDKGYDNKLMEEWIKE